MQLFRWIEVDKWDYIYSFLLTGFFFPFPILTFIYFLNMKPLSEKRLVFWSFRFRSKQCALLLNCTCFSGSLFRGYFTVHMWYVPNIALLKFLFCLPLKFARLADFFHSTQTNIKVGSRKSIGKDPKLVCCATQNFSGGHPRTMSTPTY